MQLSDGSIAQLVKLLQLAILTGTDVSDNFRTIRFVAEDGVLHLDPEYVENFDKNIEKMQAEAESEGTGD